MTSMIGHALSGRLIDIQQCYCSKTYDRITGRYTLVRPLPLFLTSFRSTASHKLADPRQLL